MATRGFDNLTEAEVSARNARIADRKRYVDPAIAHLREKHVDPFDRAMVEELAKKPSKYRNVRCVTPDGEKFDSRAEADYWLLLKARERAGEIKNLRRQVPFSLDCPSPDSSYRDGYIVEVCQYIADFVWIDGATNREVIADKKGFRTQLYKLKKRWMFLQYGIEITEI